MNHKQILPLLFIFPVLFILVSAQPILMVNASSSEDDDQENSATTNLQGGGQGIAVGEPSPDDETGGGTPGSGVPSPCDPDDDQCGTPYPGGPPPPPPPTGTNDAFSRQTGGIGAGTINQNAQGEVNRQLCGTVGGIGNRECQQQGSPGTLQDCTAVAGLGRANCVQSENPDGSGTCLSANGRPYICETSTGTAISGSGQAGLGGS